MDGMIDFRSFRSISSLLLLLFLFSIISPSSFSPHAFASSSPLLITLQQLNNRLTALRTKREKLLSDRLLNRQRIDHQQSLIHYYQNGQASTNEHSLLQWLYSTDLSTIEPIVQSIRATQHKSNDTTPSAAEKGIPMKGELTIFQINNNVMMKNELILNRDPQIRPRQSSPPPTQSSSVPPPLKYEDIAISASTEPSHSPFAPYVRPLPILSDKEIEAFPLSESSSYPSSHNVEWVYCASTHQKRFPGSDPLSLCPQTPRNEQKYHLSIFLRPKHMIGKLYHPPAPQCSYLPPIGYRFPPKHPPYHMPALQGDKWINWQNLRVEKLEDLLVFNSGWPKNLYHFEAPKYDVMHKNLIDEVMNFIPFFRLRLAIDIGAGGGSLGMWLKRRWDIQTINTVFADWPYCEYHAERQSLCVYIDSTTPFPFSKNSFDLVHSAWVYQNLSPEELRRVFNEQHRVLRSGGYLWIEGGFAQIQVDFIKQWLIVMGYKLLWQKYHMKKLMHVKFLYNPYELDYYAVYYKPSQAAPSHFCPSNQGVSKSPITKKSTIVSVPSIHLN